MEYDFSLQILKMIIYDDEYNSLGLLNVLSNSVTPSDKNQKPTKNQTISETRKKDPRIWPFFWIKSFMVF